MWFKAIEKLSELSEMTEISVGDNHLVFSNHDGEIRCFENRCPHEDFKLSLGCIQDGSIKCALHGFSFDLETGESSELGVEPLRLFRVKIEEQLIYVEINPDQ
jgi:3-phenylpropionate/trans-cinnamate dioxygenase ferredoxin subunit